MKAIPKNLLIHSGTIAGVTSTDDWGTETTTAPTELKFIRIEPYNKIVKTKNNEEVQTSALMFYDTVNSLPKGQSFTENTIININGREYRIVTIDELYDNRKLHHYEITLS